MKKICFLLCCILILQLLWGCAGKKDEFKEPVTFYYCNKDIVYNSDSGVISPEVREGASYHGNLASFLRAYLLGPASSDLQRFIPADVQLISCQVDGDTVSLIMSNQMTQLSGVALSMACSALLLTVNGYSGAQTLRLSVEDGQLDGKNEIVLSVDDIVLMDEAQ